MNSLSLTSIVLVFSLSVIYLFAGIIILRVSAEELRLFKVPDPIRKITIFGIADSIRDFSLEYNYKIYLSQILFVSLSSLYIHTSFRDLRITVIFGVILAAMYPISYLSNMRRRYKEYIFEQVLLYVTITALNVSETQNVFLSLQDSVKHIKNPIKNDVDAILKAHHFNKNQVPLLMKDFEEKYQYSIIKQLHIILRNIDSGNTKHIEKTLTQFMLDIDSLKTDVDQNKRARSSMKKEYVFIGIVSLFTFTSAINYLMGNVFSDLIHDIEFRNFRLVIVSAIFISMFFVDRFFNKTITKE